MSLKSHSLSLTQVALVAVLLASWIFLSRFRGRRIRKTLGALFNIVDNPRQDAGSLGSSWKHYTNAVRSMLSRIPWRESFEHFRRAYESTAYDYYVWPFDPFAAAAFRNRSQSRWCELDEESHDMPLPTPLISHETVYFAVLFDLCQRLSITACSSVADYMCGIALSVAGLFSSSEGGTVLSRPPEESGHKPQKPSKERFKRPCKSCRKKRRDPLFEDKAKRLTSTKHAIYCSGCQMPHPLVFFSAYQRGVRLDKSRLCIGREGFVRLCKHKVITFEEVAVAARLMAPMEERWDPKLTLGVCDHKAHLNHQTEEQLRACHNDLGLELLPRATLQKSRGNKLEVELKCPSTSQKLNVCSSRKRPREIRGRLAKLLVPELFEDEVPGIPSTETVQHCKPDHAHSRSTSGVTLTTSRAKHPSETCKENKVAAVDVCNSRTISLGLARAFEKCRCGPDRIPPEWYQALDRASYNLREDEETIGVFWCRNTNCLNFERHFGEASV